MDSLRYKPIGFDDTDEDCLLYREEDDANDNNGSENDGETKEASEETEDPIVVPIINSFWNPLTIIMTIVLCLITLAGISICFWQCNLLTKQ